jgi:c(7)-type cytochrome triheme protein
MMGREQAFRRGGDDKEATMGLKVVVATGVVTAVMVGLLAVSPLGAQSQIKTPPDFTIEKGKDSPGPVVFSHETHKAKVEKCTACHVKVFKMKKGTSGPLTMDKMKAGEQCGVCHNGKTQIGGGVVFAADDGNNCVKCHKN